VRHQGQFSDPAILHPNFFGAVLGNAENKKKAERIKASWDARKAALAAGKAVRPNRLPCWLEWDDQNDKPVVSALKTNTVRRMFDLACLGDGILTICRKMAVPRRYRPAKEPLLEPNHRTPHPGRQSRVWLLYSSGAPHSWRVGRHYR